jgi:diguanylate cyclase (GGDEF)-like protein
MSTVDRDATSRPPAQSSVTLRRLALLALPLLALGALQLWPPVHLDASPLVSWAFPAATALLSLAAASAMLVALVAGLRVGSAASFFFAAGSGGLAATYAVEAFAGPSGAASAPSGASSIGDALAGVLFVAGAVLAVRGVHWPRAWVQAAATAAVFALTELALALVTLATASDGRQGPDDAVLRLAAAGLFVVTAMLLSARTGHILWAGYLAVGALAMVLARGGSADVLVALVAMLAGTLAFTATRLPLAVEPGEAGELRARDLGPTAAHEVPLGDRAAPPEEDELAEARRLARELRGTIDELAQARRTIELQRIELERAASIDPLTGAASRRVVLERLHLEAAEARRYQHPLAVLLLDVDGLGAINAAHGVAIGDAVLREVALRMRLRIREADALGRADGGGFLAILPHTDERGATVFADTLRRRVAQRPFLVDGATLEVRVSIGVAIVRPGMDLSDDDLLANVDEALRSARAAGGDRIAFDRAHGLARIESHRAPPVEHAEGGYTAE